MASKKSISIYSSLLLLTLTLGAFVPVTSFADDGIATNDAVLTQPTTDRATTGPSTAPSDGDLARSNDSNTGVATPTPTTPATPEAPATPAPTADSSTKPADKPEDPASATDKGTSEAPQNSETPAVNVNGQPVVTVTPTAPVITAAGQTIVSNTDGTTSVVAPETVGFKVNADGTLTGKDAKGKEVTLPKTGEASTVILTMAGTFFLAAAAFWGLKKRA